MTPLQTTVLMKTDIAGSTPRFRALLAADLQALVLEHRAFIAQHAAAQGGEIVRLEGDGYWLKFPSVTGAAKSAIAMQETLRLTQTNKGDDRIAMRIVIGLGDIAFQENDLIGDMLALVVRVEAITPADEIYLTSAARLALTSSEVQTALVENFVLKGFVEPVLVYRVEQRHRTRIIDDAYILVSDLRGFTRLTETQPVVAIERVLDTLDALAHRIAHAFDGAIRFSFGNSYCLTFSNVAQLVAAAERTQPRLAGDKSGGAVRLCNQYRPTPWQDQLVPIFPLRPWIPGRCARSECLNRGAGGSRRRHLRHQCGP